MHITNLKIQVRVTEEWLAWPIAGLTLRERLTRVLQSFSEAPIAFVEPDTPISCTDHSDYLILGGAFPFLSRGLLLQLCEGKKYGEPRVAFPDKNQNAGVAFLPANHAPVEADSFPAFLDRLFDLADIDNQHCLQEVTGPVSLSSVNQYAFDRKMAQVLREGAIIPVPHQVFIEETVTVEAGAVIAPNVYLGGTTYLATGARVEMGSVLRDAVVAFGAQVKPYCVLEKCKVGAGAAVGPFAHLREGTDLGEDVKVGNFVETKKATLGAGSKASHLTYLGDAVIGRHCNIGAGTITCNYDGFSKHQTELGEGVFIGSGSQLVAPVTLGDGSYVAAGSAVTHDVPANALAVARSKQANKEDRAETIRRMARKKAARTDSE
ncbi:DapH/DapD/GlmU-related protein [Acanthopleuribacter pedis]|uniref:Mannose-1-phosphate guanyltransferase C-terminal domain-containing protein n=1 Tax=Acanthopleuribacter pedis TaxID=442870 RepID=A0A8J7Q2F6_9BACT|nr:DapH/DapD/GlmU-related protein [Acanthopleuribacter pedis]MBO1318045.1 hypothetical protein [Acanthopleuribacter pedis]